MIKGPADQSIKHIEGQTGCRALGYLTLYILEAAPPDSTDAFKKMICCRCASSPVRAEPVQQRKCFLSAVRGKCILCQFLPHSAIMPSAILKMSADSLVRSSSLKIIFYMIKNKCHVQDMFLILTICHLPHSGSRVFMLAVEIGFILSSCRRSRLKKQDRGKQNILSHNQVPVHTGKFSPAPVP